MAQIITNQASINYSYGTTTATAISNIATAVLNQPISVDKTSLEERYRADSDMTFIITVLNSGQNALSNVTVQDNLGTFTLGTAEVTPYTFAPDALLFINGVSNGVIQPVQAAGSLTFTIPVLPAGASALIVYRAAVNGFAPLTPGAQITNTVSVTADGLNESVSDSRTVEAASYADVAILKSMSPDNITDGGQIVYTFEITNRGNAPAENIVLRDAFNPAPTAITVAVNGEVVPASSYTYTDGVLTLPNGTGTPLILPAAQIVTDPATGAVSVTPSALTVTVTGTL